MTSETWETGGSRSRAFVASAIHTYHNGRKDALPRGVVVTAGRVARFFDPDSRAVRRAITAVDVLDFGSAVITPGFIDAHNHQPSAAKDTAELRTAHVRSLDELQAVLAGEARRRRDGTWISTEHSLTVSQLGLGRLPTAVELDVATDRHPVAVRFGAHTMVLNSAGLEAAGFTRSAADPTGAVIERHPSTGAPLGPIREYGAINSVLPHLARLAPAEYRDALRAVQLDYAAAGVTSVRVPGLRPGDLPAYQRVLLDDGRLSNRVFGGPRIDPTAEAEEQLATVRSWEATTGFGGDWLALDAVKIFVDGGIETAADGYDQLFLDRARLVHLASNAVDRGWSVTCHAVSETAVEIVLDAYDMVAPKLHPGSRLIIEHGFHITSRQLRRAAKSGVWLSTQPAILAVEGDLLTSRSAGHDLSRLCPLNTAQASGVRCALGSDWNATPGTRVRPFSPLASVEVAASRRTAAGKPLGAREAVDRSTAMYLHTRAPAELLGRDDLGGLWAGAHADFVALSADPSVEGAAPEVVATVVGGQPVKL